MILDYKKIEEEIRGFKEIGIVSTCEYSYLIDDIHTKIKSINNDIEIFLLGCNDIICPLKINYFPFYICLGIGCPEHKFENVVFIKDSLCDEELILIKNHRGRVILDSSYDDVFENYNKHDLNEDSGDINEVLVVSKNRLFCEYYNFLYKCKFLFKFNEKSKQDFLMSRINKAEKLRDKNVFTIVYTNIIYEETAIKVKKELCKIGRYGYLLFLKNVSYSRLITIEGIDAIVLIDCPVFENINIDTFIPLVTPYEINYLISKKFEYQYDRNKIMEHYNIQNKEITVIEGAGKVVLQNEFIGISYECNEKDYGIYEGRSGIAAEYDDEK